MVATMSLIANPNPNLDAASIDLVAAGVPFTVSAGNNNHGDACAWSPGVVGNPNNVAVNPVGASDPLDDTAAPFTNIGPCLDLFAPGMNMTTLNDEATEGTSVATPLVAGVAALRLEMEPALTATQVENAIKGYASTGRLTAIGMGSPNLLLYSHTRRRRACCS
jgi:subtilisin family serine protease